MIPTTIFLNPPSACYDILMKDSLLTLVETLSPKLQTKVYEYALSLQKTALPHAQPLILNMHKGAMTIAEDFDEPLPNSFWLGEE